MHLPQTLARDPISPSRRPGKHAPARGFRLHSEDGRHELSAGPELPTLRITLFGQRPAFTSEPRQLTQLFFRMEESRGYDSQGDLWSPGYFRSICTRQMPPGRVNGSVGDDSGLAAGRCA